MFLTEFNQKPATKVAKINKVLQEQFGITIKTNFPSLKKLEKVLENTNMALIKLRGTNKKFQLDPDYAKFLGIKDVIETLISEGMYAKSPAHESMCGMVRETVRNLMDSGYTVDEAATECMNRYRMDDRFAYDDEYVLPIVITAGKEYMEQCSMGEAALAGGEMGATIGNTITGMPAHNQISSKNVAEQVLRVLAKEAGVDLSTTTSYEPIEEKLKQKAAQTGKKRESFTDEWKAKMSASKTGENNNRYGVEVTAETRKKIGDKLRGRKQTEEEKLARGIANLGKKREKKLCPHCSKEVAVNGYARWHGDNCKQQ